MDPFAPDSEGEEEHPLGASQAHASRHGQASSDAAIARSVRHPSSSASTVANGASTEDEDEDGPPLSILLGVQEGVKTPVQKKQALPSVDSPPMLGASSAEAGPSRLVESVRMGTLGSNGRTSKVYAEQREDALERGDGITSADEDEEDTGLISNAKPSSSSSSSSTRRNRDKGLFHNFARKVKKRASRIQAEDGILGSGNGTRSNVSKGLSPRDRALWDWGTLDNLDEFLQEVYAYYVGKGLFCIALTKALNLLTIAFVIGFSTFLVGCVDYTKIQHDGKLSDVIVDQCVSRFSGSYLLAFGAFVAFYGWQVVRFGLGFSRLLAMRDFYGHLLKIPDADVQSIPWHEVVTRISHLRQTYPNTSISSTRDGVSSAESKLDAHDVANRIMRQENYLVALFNKDVLNLRLPFPGFQSRPPELTKMLEWNLSFCLLGFLFDSKGQVRRQFLTDKHRKDLIEGIRRRFIFMAVINAIFAPFIILYLLFYSFFRYFEEYHKNPSTLGSRQYTQFARWKFREFNELPHLFRQRCHNSYPYAQRYIDQFPKERIAIVARFVSFVAGSFTAVLLLASVIDPDLFVHFDITHQRNVLFYIGVFGAITAVSRSMVPDDQQVFEPDLLLRAVIEHTHYLPEQWKGRFHSADVHAEFGGMYKLKIWIFLNEILSVVLTPFILWRSLPTSAPGIIDFFREFTVHVDGLGYVCSFAIFDFRRHGNVHFGVPEGVRDGFMSSKEGKMEQSLLGFRAANPSWQPSDPSASLFLSRLVSSPPSNGVHGGGHYNHNNNHRARTASGHAPGPSSAATAGSGPGRGIGLSHHTGGGNNMHNFTPANSTLAQRSQLYTEAFERSISLATKPSNALALQASAIKTGPRSVAAKTLQAVSEGRDQDDGDEEGDGLGRVFGAGEDSVDADLDPNSTSAYEDARPEVLLHSQKRAGREESASRDQVNLRGLLQHIGSQW